MPRRTALPFSPGPATLALSLLLLLFLLLIPSRVVAREPGDTGLVVSVAGEVQVRRAGGAHDAAEGFVLFAGDTITVRTGGRCTGFVPAGEAFDLAGPAQYVLGEAGDRRGLDNVKGWVQRQLAQWIGESRSQPLATRSQRDWDVRAGAPGLLVPAAGGAVRPEASRFIWSTITGVDRYCLVVAPATGDELTRIVRGNEAVLPDLEPGAEYVWKVKPLLDDWPGEAPWRGFRVMTADEARRLDEAVASLGDLEAGVLLLSAGLEEEALARLDAAVTLHARGRSALLWRSRALARVGLHDQACADLLEALGRQ
ncbi:MAG: hypothetical protein JW819_02785 [Candidatus Krumholzibacteriota bacterium]|nr:hypothetical protein [Candidatus Krumholzibacteriota bacterium]